MKIDAYNKKTINVVINQNLSFTSGFAAGQINAGTMVNKGIESEFSVDIIRGKDVLVALGGNLAITKIRSPVLDRSMSLYREQALSGLACHWVSLHCKMGGCRSGYRQPAVL